MQSKCDHDSRSISPPTMNGVVSCVLPAMRRCNHVMACYLLRRLAHRYVHSALRYYIFDI